VTPFRPDLDKSLRHITEDGGSGEMVLVLVQEGALGMPPPSQNQDFLNNKYKKIYNILMTGVL
jgi:hypothetical protein